MTYRNSLLLYVADAQASAAFYARLLGQKPVEASPTFAFFILPTGLGLGLWDRTGVVPAPTGAAGSGDLGLRVDSPAEVDARHDEWKATGASILLPPTELDFGRSFVAADPDGHRVRVYTVRDE